MSIPLGMQSMRTPRWLSLVVLSVLVALLGSARADSPADEAKELIPWKAMDEKNRARVTEVIDHATVHHRTPHEVFVCAPELYLLLLHEPVMTLELWRSLGGTNATLESVGPGQFQGTDGHVSSGRWEFVYRS